MALDSETQRLIRIEVQKQLNILLPGVSQNATGFAEDISNMFPGQPVIPARPTVRPYGFVSRAPAGTTQVTARMGSHPANRMIVGHRDDENAPSLPDSGDSALYSPGGTFYALKDKLQLLAASGFVVEANATGLQIGKGSASITMVCGEDLVAFLGAMLDAIISHQHPNGNPLTGTPTNAGTFSSLKSIYITSPTILAKTGGKF